jgi:hypothetical protein
MVVEETCSEPRCEPSSKIVMPKSGLVWFLQGSWPNLELDFRFGSANLSNLEPDHRFRFSKTIFHIKFSVYESQSKLHAI